jgi:RNA 3'-terminal phosphate cyclase (ATP)
MIQIDGSEGEGGGQVIRSSLALSMITGKPFTIDNIRGRRSNAGLARQHLTCVHAAKEICDAEVSGDRLRSSSISFLPGTVKPGDYCFQIGTAGSTTLVAQTVLPALMNCESDSTVTVVGGTHNQKAPPFDFFKEAYVKLVDEMGPTVAVELKTYGFYPAGGGKIEIDISPASHWYGLTLIDSQKFKPYPIAIVSGLPRSIAQRECDTICRSANWPSKNSVIIEVENPRGPGNIVMIKLVSKSTTELFSEVGKIGVKAEQVARRVLKRSREFLTRGVPVGPHLADQLLLPMAIAATYDQPSKFRTVALSQHSRTHIDIIKRFLEVNIVVTEISNDVFEVEVRPVAVEAFSEEQI